MTSISSFVEINNAHVVLNKFHDIFSASSVVEIGN